MVLRLVDDADRDKFAKYARRSYVEDNRMVGVKVEKRTLCIEQLLWNSKCRMHSCDVHRSMTSYL
jgi:hypothetical protein